MILRTPYFIMKDLVNRHEELKNPAEFGDYGQDDELFNLLDELSKSLKAIHPIDMKETLEVKEE